MLQTSHTGKVLSCMYPRLTSRGFCSRHAAVVRFCSGMYPRIASRILCTKHGVSAIAYKPSVYFPNIPHAAARFYFCMYSRLTSQVLCSRHATVVTSECCELILVEKKDFRIIWEVGLLFVLTEPVKVQLSAKNMVLLDDGNYNCSRNTCIYTT